MAGTVNSRVRHEVVPTKGSRFIVTVEPVSSETAAKELLASVSHEMPDANHHCWAWRIAEPAIDRAGDAGEPGGSAGRPILSALTGRDLVDTAVIVTRYFGGTKLGVGGLVRAYGGAASEALDLADVSPWTSQLEIAITHAHGDSDAVARCLAQAHATQLEVIYGASVTRRVEVSVDAIAALSAALADATAGRVGLACD